MYCSVKPQDGSGHFLQPEYRSAEYISAMTALQLQVGDPAGYAQLI